MTRQIVITEKASQAKDVRGAVGSRYGAVLAAEGHLLDLCEPEDVNPEWKRWSTALLKPDGLYGTKPATGGNKAAKLKAIRAALKTADRVWLATDCDREGQLIGQEILEHCRYRGEVLRVLFTAQDAETIRAAFRRARPNGEHARLYEAAVARRQADQIYNLSLTRTATVTLGQGSRGVIGIGRVKTPTLAIACRRELEIRDFVPLGYFEVVATAHAEGGAFKMRHAPKERIVERAKAEAVAEAAREFEGPLGVHVEDKRQRPPRLHDLPSLQKLCSSRFGWSASKTLEVAQELYDGEGKKILTYPRAEVRYLPESAAADVPKIVAGLRAGRTYADIPVPSPPAIRKGRNGAFHDKGLEGASHHAIVPNVNKIGDLREVWPRLTADEKKLFDAVARSYLASVMPDYRYRQTTVTMDVRGFEFRATGRQPIEAGLARRLSGVAARRGEGRGGAGAAATTGRRGRASPRSGDRGQGDAPSAPLQGGHSDRGDAERMALRRGRGAAREAAGGQGDRDARDAGGDHLGPEEAGVPDGAGEEHRAHRPGPGAVRCARARRSRAGGPGRDGGAGVPARRCADRSAGDDGSDRRGVRFGPAHHRPARGALRGWRGRDSRRSRWRRRRPAADGEDAEVRGLDREEQGGQAASRIHEVGGPVPGVP